MKTTQHISIRHLLTIAGGALLLAGCATIRERQTTDLGGDPAPQPAAAPATAPPAPASRAPSGKQTCAVITSGLVNMSKTMPAEVSLGQEFSYQLSLTAAGCAANVVVIDRIPSGATYVRSESPAEVQGGNLVWHLADLDLGDSKSIKVWLRADREGTITSCALVSAEPRVCGSTFVGKPVLAIEKSGPETALLNSDVAYNVIVSNRGTTLARDVVVTDEIPDGLAHSSGQSRLTFNVGDLAPNQSRSIPVTLKAMKRGRHCNNAIATASNAAKVSDDACTLVVQPGLKIEKTTADRELLINRTASYDIVLSNTGDVPLTGVVVTDTAATETSIVSAEGGTVSGNTATWNIGGLAAGQKRTLNIKIMSKTPGRFCNTASVTTTQGLKDSSQACTEWIGVTGLSVEVVDDPDPIQVNETTTFTVRVTNQGTTRALEGLAIKAFFPEEITPLTASSGGTVAGKTVTWPVVASVPARQTISYTIQARGVKVGDGRMRVEVTTRVRQNPIVEFESTTVY